MNTQETKVSLDGKLSAVAVPGKHKVPTSKAAMIRLLGRRHFDTGAIKKKLEQAGINVHYSEIYGALDRLQPAT